MLQLIGLKLSTFFYHLALKVNKNADVEQKLTEIYHENNGNYGYRRITLTLRKHRAINHKRVQTIMHSLACKENVGVENTLPIKGEVGKKADNLLQQNFHATSQNKKWVTNITEFKCTEGKLYLSPIKDLFN